MTYFYCDPILLELYRHRFAGVAEEMGVTLRRTGYSPNIKERLVFSCAVFDAEGRLVAQAAHIPVHLGAMPASTTALRAGCSIGISPMDHLLTATILVPALPALFEDL